MDKKIIITQNEAKVPQYEFFGEWLSRDIKSIIESSANIWNEYKKKLHEQGRKEEREKQKQEKEEIENGRDSTSARAGRKPGRPKKQ